MRTSFDVVVVEVAVIFCKHERDTKEGTMGGCPLALGLLQIVVQLRGDTLQQSGQAMQIARRTVQQRSLMHVFVGDRLERVQHHVEGHLLSLLSVQRILGQVGIDRCGQLLAPQGRLGSVSAVEETRGGTTVRKDVERRTTLVIADEHALQREGVLHQTDAGHAEHQQVVEQVEHVAIGTALQTALAGAVGPGEQQAARGGQQAVVARKQSQKLGELCVCLVALRGVQRVHNLTHLAHHGVQLLLVRVQCRQRAQSLGDGAQMQKRQREEDHQ
mmetsp:Transcript_17922/g.53854  ORF Transcript_17922/g.53854 Transcript_17922/m.53854 type:complete len:273 (-) Transcript_17922:2264-3082(-)